MPVLTPHWDILKRNGMFRKEAGDGQQTRFPVLMSLLGRANIRLRCWPSVETLIEDLALNDKTSISGALKWLADHGAIYNVPVDKRVGREKWLLPQKYVFQLTGIIEIDGVVMEYILMQPEEREAMIDELRELGAEHAIELYALLEEKPAPDPEGEDEGVGRESLPSRSAQPTKLVGSPTPEALPISSTKEAITPPASQSGKCSAKGGVAALEFAIDDTPVKPKKATSSLLADHLEATTGKKLTKQQRQKLAKAFKHSEAGVSKTEYPSPEILYADEKSGFSRFVSQRLDYYKSRDSLGEIKFIVGDICNYTRAGQGKQPGWLAWREKNMHLIAPPPEGSEVPLHQRDRVAMVADEPDMSFLDDITLPVKKTKDMSNG